MEISKLDAVSIRPQALSGGAEVGFIAASRWDADAPRYPASEICSMLSSVSDRGIDVDRCLFDSGLDRASLGDSASRVSFKQQMAVQRRIIELTSDRLSPALLAGRLHLSSYGVAGCAVLSSPTLADALRLIGKLADFMVLKHELQLQVNGQFAVLRLVPKQVTTAASDCICELFEVTKLVNLLRDCVSDFKPSALRLRQSVDPHLDSTLRRLTQTPSLVGNSAVTEIWFEAASLSIRLPLAESTACTALVSICENLTKKSRKMESASKRVRELLKMNLRSVPSMTEVASQLSMSSRSLRRHLDAERTSFQILVGEHRCEEAAQLLAETRMTTEVIADELGYGDAANFRHAFKRWTGKSPSQYRRSIGLMTQAA